MMTAWSCVNCNLIFELHSALVLLCMFASHPGVVAYAMATALLSGQSSVEVSEWCITVQPSLVGLQAETPLPVSGG